MDERQRATAAVDGYVVERVTIPRFEPEVEGEEDAYTVRVAIKAGDSRVEVAPVPPTGR